MNRPELSETVNLSKDDGYDKKQKGKSLLARGARAGGPKLNGVWNAALSRHGVFKSSGKTYLSLALTEAVLDLTCEATAGKSR